MLTLNEVRCRPAKTDCSLKERCDRFLSTIPQGGCAADFSAGPAGCVGKFVPVIGLVLARPRAVHDHPGGAL